MLHLGAFESTKIHGSGQDILGTTRHIERWEYDLRLLESAGIRNLRYSIPWHRIERQPGEFDFSWIDGPMAFIKAHNMTAIADPLHHTSFPDWLSNGFANPQFPELYERFVEKLARRYDWVEQYTVFNEPFPTTLFCSYTGWWYPHQRSDAAFAVMAMNVGQAIANVTSMLGRMNSSIRFIHVDTCEGHQAMDRRSEAWVDFANHRRFLMHDLLFGRLNREHPLYGYFIEHGARPDRLLWFEEHPTKIDVLGLDYYYHSDMEWYWDDQLGRPNISPRCTSPLGFLDLAGDYVRRFRTPVMLAETNLRGSKTDRVTWLKLMHEQAEELASRTDFRGFCWYPSIDSTDWDQRCTTCSNSIDPQGIWSLDATRWERHPSILSHWYMLLATGAASSRDVPAYRFSAPLDDTLAGYERFMEHWEGWLDPADAERVA
jgi:hypothetical protein